MYALFQKIRVLGIALLASAFLAGCGGNTLTRPSLQSIMESTPITAHFDEGYITEARVEYQKEVNLYCYFVADAIAAGDNELLLRGTLSFLSSLFGGMGGALSYNEIASASLPVVATGGYVALPTTATTITGNVFDLRSAFRWEVRSCAEKATMNDLVVFAFKHVEGKIGEDEYNRLVAAREKYFASSPGGATKVSPYGAGNPPHPRPTH